jgi:hypothetical protein
MPIELSAEKIIRFKGNLKSQRQTFDTYYQTLHDYFYVEGENINRTYYPGNELDFFYLLDGTSIELADVLASGIMNYLTPGSTRWFALEHPDKAIRERKDVRQWMQDTTDEVNYILNRSNFYNQMPQFYKGSGVYGTSVLMLEEDYQDDLRFYNLPIKSVYVTEDAREKPLEFYMCFEFTAEQAYTKFGDKIDKDIFEAMKDQRNPDKCYSYIYYLGPRQMQEYGKSDRANMPVRGVWIEEKTKNIMVEDGYKTMPAVAHRFYKRPKIPYGFSPAMKALPWVRMLNTMADTMLRAAMKQTDPPLALPDNGFLAPMDFNPRAQNFYKKGRLDPQKDIAPIGNYGKPSIGIETIQYYTERAGDIMFKNAFLSFQDITKQMTIPEVMQRANESLTLLGPAVGRYMDDVLQPLIERAILMLWDKGKLPPLPDEMILNPEYDVKFIGRLAQAQKQSELNNLTNALTIAGQIAQYKPEALDKINADATIDELWGITNAPAGMVYDMDEVEEIRQARAQQQQVMEQIQMAQAASTAGKDATQADKNIAEAQNIANQAGAV